MAVTRELALRQMAETPKDREQVALTEEQKTFWNAAIEAAAAEADVYPRTSSVGKPLSGIAIAAVIRKLKK